MILQATALPLLEGKLCLITSASGKRWVTPKGIIDPGMTPAETALQESWEEAGLRGELEPGSLGSFTYEKWGDTLRVTVFLMHVQEVADEWPERGVRRREWLKPAAARARITDEGLRRIIKEHVG